MGSDRPSIERFKVGDFLLTIRRDDKGNECREWQRIGKEANDNDDKHFGNTL